MIVRRGHRRGRAKCSTNRPSAEKNLCGVFCLRRRDYLRLYGQAESRGFYERLDGFADAGVRSREPTAENKASHFQTFRRLWFKPLTTAKTPRRQKCHLGVLVEATGFAPLAARPRRSKACFAGICLWQTPRCLRLLLLFPQIFCFAKPLREPSIICLPGCSVCAEQMRQQTIRAQTVCSRKRLHSQIPSMFVKTGKRADTNRLSFPWSRRRDYPRLYGQAESRGFYERLDGFADAGVRSREPTAENKASHFQTFRRLWFKPLTTAKTPRRQKCHLGVLSLIYEIAAKM